MGKVRRFEDLIVWQKARALTAKIYRAARASEFSRDQALARQVCRSAVSTMSNIAEGFERSSRRELLQFLNVAKGSCGEIRSHLYVALDAGYLQATQFQELKADAETISRMLAALQSSIRAAGPRTARQSKRLAT